MESNTNTTVIDTISNTNISSNTSTSTTAVTNYSNAEYWNQRYDNSNGNTTNTESFDWYCDYSQLEPLISKLTSTNTNSNSIDRSTIRILHLGIGNSNLMNELYTAGYINQTGIDISAECIKQHQSHNSIDKPTLVYYCMDLIDLVSILANNNSYYDLIIDKGTLDAISCSNNNHNNNTDTNLMITNIYQSIYQLLTPETGYFLLITHNQNNLLQLLTNTNNSYNSNSNINNNNTNNYQYNITTELLPLSIKTLFIKQLKLLKQRRRDNNNSDSKSPATAIELTKLMRKIQLIQILQQRINNKQQQQQQNNITTTNNNTIDSNSDSDNDSNNNKISSFHQYFVHCYICRKKD